MIAVKLLKRQPWRFNAGEQVYVQGWEAGTTGLVVEQLRDGLAFPHYLVVDPEGHEWDIAQLRLSSRPIGDHG
jgi:hypothetical protein